MKRLLSPLVALLAFSLPATLSAQHTRASLVLSATSAKPGDTIMAGVRLKMDKGWHTYWRYGGDSGDPTKIKWTLPEGLTAGEIQWPVPEKSNAEDLYTYVYENEVMLLVPLKLETSLAKGPTEVKASVSWLECEVACVPGEAEVSAKLEIADSTQPSPAASQIDSWQKKLPSAKGTDLNPRATWAGPASKNKRQLIIEWTLPEAPAKADFYPYAGEEHDVGGETSKVSLTNGKIHLEKQVTLNSKDLKAWPKKIDGILVTLSEEGKPMVAWEVSLPLDVTTEKPTAATTPESGGKSASLLTMLAFAFLGGLILNIMPCVLPVIALKILGFVSQSKEAPARVRTLGLIYALGVLASFLVLAGIVIGVKSAGHQASWGMQFSNPQFIVIFTVLVTLVALNLFGVFEVTLSGRVMGAAGDLASRHGASGAFFNGVLATILATPCTAPFLGAALGFAFSQSAVLIVLMFLTIGIGLAAPYVVLSWHPAWLKFLPKPGAWMEKFKIAMGFPMLATAVWLFSLTTTFYGERSWWLGIFLVLVGAAAWVFGAFVQHGGNRRWLGAAMTVLLLAVGYFWALDGKLAWRIPVEDSPAKGALAHAPKGYTWQPWSTEAVSAARSQGRPVVVDFTAKWCVTCNATVKPALERSEVIAKLKELNVIALVADNTKFPPAIAAELAHFGRAGVPMVLVYPSDASRPALVLPEPLSPSPGSYGRVILDALKKASSDQNLTSSVQ